MDSLFPEAMLQRIENCGVIAVLVIDEPENAVPLARALLACGIDDCKQDHTSSTAQHE